MVKRLARMMLAYERLEAGGSIGPRSARRLRASSSESPVGSGGGPGNEAVSAVSVSDARLPPLAAPQAGPAGVSRRHAISQKPSSKRLQAVTEPFGVKRPVCNAADEGMLELSVPDRVGLPAQLVAEPDRRAGHE